MNDAQVVAHLPIVCVDAIVVKGGKVLLIQRLTEPVKNELWFPGGRLRKSETFEDAAVRYCLEFVSKLFSLSLCLALALLSACSKLLFFASLSALVHHLDRGARVIAECDRVQVRTARDGAHGAAASRAWCHSECVQYIGTRRQHSYCERKRACACGGC